MKYMHLTLTLVEDAESSEDAAKKGVDLVRTTGEFVIHVQPLPAHVEKAEELVDFISVLPPEIVQQAIRDDEGQLTFPFATESSSEGEGVEESPS